MFIVFLRSVIFALLRDYCTIIMTILQQKKHKCIYFVAIAKASGDDNHYIDLNISRCVTLLHIVKVKRGDIYLIASRKTEAYRQCTVYLVHSALVKLTHTLLEPLLVERSYLLEQYD